MLPATAVVGGIVVTTTRVVASFVAHAGPPYMTHLKWYTPFIRPEMGDELALGVAIVAVLGPDN